VTAWGIIFGINLHCIIINRPQMNEKMLLFIGYAIPLLPPIVFSLLSASDQALSAIQFYANIVPLLYLLFVYGKIVIDAKQILNQASAKRLIQQTLYYPAVLGVNLILTMVAGVIAIDDECLTPTNLLLNGFWCFQGLIDAALYGNNSIVRKEYRRQNTGQSPILLES